MKISVAMCTYNGARFISEQLESIAAQSQPIDELVVCDDKSTDNTLQLIQDFQHRVSFSIRVFVNEQNLGSTRNFQKCLSLCEGDLIFLCDQDDVWLTHKVKKMLRYLTQNPNQEAVFSDANIINNQSALTGKRAWQLIQFNRRMQTRWQLGGAFDILVNGYVVTGATLAIRRRVLSEILPFPNLYKDLIHDGWIALWLSLTNRIGFIKEPLTNYRQHSQQQVGFGAVMPKVTLEERIARLREKKLMPLRKKYEESQILYDHLASFNNIPKDKLEQLRQRSAHFLMRSTLPNNHLWRVWPVLQDVFNGKYKNHNAAKWWRPVLGDIFE